MEAAYSLHEISPHFAFGFAKRGSGLCHANCIIYYFVVMSDVVCVLALFVPSSAYLQ